MIAARRAIRSSWSSPAATGWLRAVATIVSTNRRSFIELPRRDHYASMASLTFLGAARTVTGSKYLIEHDGVRVLVDCGLFQGLKSLRDRNWEDFPVPADSITAVVLTHAHLDHVGYLPRLVAAGFRGRAFCTAGTQDLCRLVLPDSGRIQEEDARQANKHKYNRHASAMPLYGEVRAPRTTCRCRTRSRRSAPSRICSRLATNGNWRLRPASAPSSIPPATCSDLH